MIMIIVAAVVALAAGFVLFVWKRSRNSSRLKHALEAATEKGTPEQPQRISCQKCGASNPSTAKFCEACGEKLQ